MAKKHKPKEKTETKFSKYLPGESTWTGRRNKTRQDLIPMGQRDRVETAQKIRSFSMQHKPSCTKDWLKLRVH